MAWQLQFDDGRTVEVDGMLVIGRAPLANEGDDVVIIDDPTVSKMHVVAYADAENVVVTDCESTNGTLAGPKNAMAPCVAGEPVRINEGDVVRMGEREFVVAKA